MINQILTSKTTPLIPILDKDEKPKAGEVDTSAFDQQIDETVYELYGLTDDEIKIVEGKG